MVAYQAKHPSNGFFFVWRLAITEQLPSELPQPLVTRISVQAAVPELVNRTLVHGHRQFSLDQSVRPQGPVSKPFGHCGNQVGMAQNIAQRHVMRKRQSKVSVQFLLRQINVDPTVSGACGNHAHVFSGYE